MKLKSLEGLRGLAAFSVVLFHFFTRFYPTLVNGTPDQIQTSYNIELFLATTPLNVFYNGNFAVCIFFTLSGFVLSYKFFQTKDPKVIQSSAIRRYFRLMIPVLLSVMCFYVAYQFKNPYAPNTIQHFSLINALKEGLYGAFFSISNQYNPVLWTMHFEFFGSFLVFGFCLLFGTHTRRWVIYLFCILLLWKSSYLAFLLGMMMCDVMINVPIKIKSTALKAIILLTGIFLGSYPNHIGTIPGSIGINDTIYRYIIIHDVPYVVYQNFGSLLVLFALLVSERLSKFFSFAPFQFLGRISFSLYLTHIVFISFFSIWFINQLKMVYINAFLLTFTTSIVMIFIFSYVFEKLVDENAVRFSKWVHQRFFTRNQ